MTSNMGDWEALAEIHLDGQQSHCKDRLSTYCLCSRVFIKNYYDVYASTLEKDEDVSETEEAVEEQPPLHPPLGSDDNHVHFSVVSAAELLIETAATGPAGSKRIQEDADNDANSCYYSASASHTDNYCSTDEHEHHVGSRQQVLNNNSKNKTVAIAASKRPIISERLHSSDSGADISENHLLDKMRWPADRKNGPLVEGPAEDDEETPQIAHFSADECEKPPCSQAHRMTTAAEAPAPATTSSPPHAVHERNNSLPNVLCPEELATEWETFWNRHGEQLIWASWIEKYSDYIEPGFQEGLGVAQEADSETVNEKRDDCSTANTLHDEKNIFTFDDEEIEGIEAPLLSTVALHLVLPTEIVVSHCSALGQKVPGLDEEEEEDDEVGDYEYANGGPWSSYRRSNRLSVDERLLSPRCDSADSSIPRAGAAATDSMTNVTRMTLSSGEFCSSKVTSESSQNNDSMTTSTTTSEAADEGATGTFSSSQFYDAIDSHQPGGQGKLDPGAARIVGGQPQRAEDAMDVDQHWQVLWEKHFQELYAKHYKEFIEEQSQRLEDRLDRLSGSLKTEAIFEECEEERLPGTKAQQRRSRSVKRLRKSANECLPKLVANLKIRSCGAKEEGGGENATAAEDATTPAVDQESNLMASMGLPQSFGSTPRPSGNNNAHKGPGDDDDDGDGERPPRQKVTTLKRSHESDSEEANNKQDRIKDAFQLMGFAYENQSMAEKEEPEKTASGEVVYRKKHIRLHNRALKMKIQTRPKLHIRFDEEGNACDESSTDAAEVVEVLEGAGVTPATAADPVLLHSSSDDDSGGIKRHLHGRHKGAQGGGILDRRIDRVRAQEKAVAGQGDLRHQGPETLCCSNTETGGHYGEATTGDGEEQQVKKKKRKRKGKITALLPPEIANDKTLMKYWYKRFSLFQMFDLGIRMDRESWFSVTPEKVAAHAAERCRCDLIVDGFCGVGGNAIQFALTCERVIAIDIDPKKIEMARHNAGIYGVADRIEFIVGDFFHLADSLKADVVFLSPPWGGPQYMKVDTYDLEEHLQPVAASVMMDKARQISSNVAIFIPRNSNTQQLTLLAGPGGRVEIEQSFLDRKLIALTAYYGELINE